MTTLHQHMFYTAASCIGKHPRVLHQCKPKNINIIIKIIHELLVITKNIHSHALTQRQAANGTSSLALFVRKSQTSFHLKLSSNHVCFSLLNSFCTVIRRAVGSQNSVQTLSMTGEDCNRLGRKRPLLIPVRANYLDFNNENGCVKNANLIKGRGCGGVLSLCGGEPLVFRRSVSVSNL